MLITLNSVSTMRSTKNVLLLHLRYSCHQTSSKCKGVDFCSFSTEIWRTDLVLFVGIIKRHISDAISISLSLSSKIFLFFCLFRTNLRMYYVVVQTDFESNFILKMGKRDLNSAIEITKKGEKILENWILLL